MFGTKDRCNLPQPIKSAPSQNSSLISFTHSVLSKYLFSKYLLPKYLCSKYLLSQNTYSEDINFRNTVPMQFRSACEQVRSPFYQFRWQGFGIGGGFESDFFAEISGNEAASGNDFALGFAQSTPIGITINLKHITGLMSLFCFIKTRKKWPFQIPPYTEALPFRSHSRQPVSVMGVGLLLSEGRSVNARKNPRGGVR